MQKVIKVDSKVIVIFEDGSYFERNEVSEELFNQVINAKTDEEVFYLMCPKYQEVLDEVDSTKELLNRIETSSILTLEGEITYWKEVSELSLPTELIKAILDAEDNNDNVKLETYKNFWTLMSLNPDEKCRKNLFWFLQRNGLVLSRCGFFVAYRNAVPNGKLNGKSIYTDAHSYTTHIEIGKVVTIPREQCDCDSDKLCSRGLICSPLY